MRRASLEHCPDPRQVRPVSLEVSPELSDMYQMQELSDAYRCNIRAIVEAFFERENFFSSEVILRVSDQGVLFRALLTPSEQWGDIRSLQNMIANVLEFSQSVEGWANIRHPQSESSPVVRGLQDWSISSWRKLEEVGGVPHTVSSLDLEHCFLPFFRFSYQTFLCELNQRVAVLVRQNSELKTYQRLKNFLPCNTAQWQEALLELGNVPFQEHLPDWQKTVLRQQFRWGVQRFGNAEVAAFRGVAKFL